ncbi:hypothetical protein TNCV_2107761 [Trichonephila clavipes]|nr:hypothetical protein TNCV_2107761 [Trichonephila clavipes]
MGSHWEHETYVSIWIDGNLKAGKYISDILPPVLCPIFKAIFQQSNAILRAVCPVLTFLDTQGIRLFPWPTRSPVLSLVWKTPWKTSGYVLLRDIPLIQLMKCGIDLKPVARFCHPSTARPYPCNRERPL